VIGGDLSSAPVWIITVTVMGRTRAPISRGGAEAGDQLWITGTLGLARAALESWRRGDSPTLTARTRFAHPEPRIAAGRWLARHGAHAMIDLSDGLGGDAAHLAAASRVALAIQLESLPVSPDVEEEAGRAGVSAHQFAAESGEEYELLVSMPPRFNAVDAFTHECGMVLTQIGQVEPGNGVRFRLGGREVQLRGFDHFR
jgi:thiamine-monophosphate kinase